MLIFFLIFRQNLLEFYSSKVMDYGGGQDEKKSDQKVIVTNASNDETVVIVESNIFGVWLYNNLWFIPRFNVGAHINLNSVKVER